MNTIILCEYSGEVAQAFRDKGESAWSCDLLAGERPKYHIEGDAYSALTAGRPTDGAKWTKAGLHWPCTYFTNSGVRWLYYRGTRARVDERWSQMTESADGLCRIINHLLSRGIPFYFENPVMHKYAREAIIARLPWFSTAQYQVIQPWHFGTWETKATCLWLHRLPPPDSKVSHQRRMPHGSWASGIHRKEWRDVEESPRGESSFGFAWPKSRPRTQPYATNLGARHGRPMGRHA